MHNFDSKINNYYRTILEQDMPAAAPAAAGAAPADPNAAAAMPPPGGDMGAGGGAGGDMGGDAGGQPASAGDMDNEAKRDADPREYTRSILALLVDNKEGVTPEMFDDFIDSVSLAITKIKDKEGLKQFYGKFYQKLVMVLELREELQSMFKQLHGTLDDLVGAQTEPDAAGGGEGMSGPAGPGVK